MKIKRYIENYTDGNKIRFREVLDEVKEFFIELFRFNRIEMKEELEDVFHFLQLWFYWRFGVNGEVWGITKNSVNKFIKRKKVWQEIYVFSGLNKNISGFCGNCNKIEKVINHLSKFGIGKEKASEVYKLIVLKKE